MNILFVFYSKRVFIMLKSYIRACVFPPRNVFSVRNLSRKQASRIGPNVRLNKSSWLSIEHLFLPEPEITA